MRLNRQDPSQTTHQPMSSFPRSQPLPLHVRRAVLDDLDVLVRFAQAMAQETEDKTLEEAPLRAGVRAALRDPDRGTYFVAVQGERSISDAKRVGALMVTREWSDWRNGFFWWVQSVYVRPPCRQQGVYRQLYTYVRERALDRSEVCGLRLYVEEDNAAARAAYEALGMRETSYRLYEAEF